MILHIQILLYGYQYSLRDHKLQSSRDKRQLLRGSRELNLKTLKQLNLLQLPDKALCHLFIESKNLKYYHLIDSSND
jgi:hypothetical protein